MIPSQTLRINNLKRFTFSLFYLKFQSLSCLWPLTPSTKGLKMQMRLESSILLLLLWWLLLPPVLLLSLMLLPGAGGRWWKGGRTREAEQTNGKSTWPHDLFRVRLNTLWFFEITSKSHGHVDFRLSSAFLSLLFLPSTTKFHQTPKDCNIHHLQGGSCWILGWE